MFSHNRRDNSAAIFRISAPVVTPFSEPKMLIKLKFLVPHKSSKAPAFAASPSPATASARQRGLKGLQNCSQAGRYYTGMSRYDGLCDVSCATFDVSCVGCDAKSSFVGAMLLLF